jgi:hypothetical protein
MPKPIGKRYIDGDSLLAKIESEAAVAASEAPRSAMGVTVGAKIRAVLLRQPKAPELVNNQATAKILGVLPNHLGRYRDRLPEPVKVEGTDRPMYLKSEIQALGKELARERKAKAKEKAA